MFVEQNLRQPKIVDKQTCILQVNPLLVTGIKPKVTQSFKTLVKLVLSTLLNLK